MTLDTPSTARARLVHELREHALVIGEVVLTSGRTAQYLVDAKRAILRPAGFLALAELVAEQARAWGATAVGGMTMGADPIACAALAGGADVKAFFVRKEVKQHGLSRRIEGPLLDRGGPLHAGRGRGHHGRLDDPRDRGRPRRRSPGVRGTGDLRPPRRRGPGDRAGGGGALPER